MVVPVGVFQAAADGPVHQRNDFSLWRCLLREFAEELLGEPEYLDDDAPIDYAARPLAASMTAARDQGLIRVDVLGMGVDPLTFATDLLTVVCLDSEVYDDLFGDVVTENSEGRLYRRRGSPGSLSPRTLSTGSPGPNRFRLPVWPCCGWHGVTGRCPPALDVPADHLVFLMISISIKIGCLRRPN